MREGELGRRVPSGSSESEAGPINQVTTMFKEVWETDICIHVYSSGWANNKA